MLFPCLTDLLAFHSKFFLNNFKRALINIRDEESEKKWLDNIVCPITFPQKVRIAVVPLKSSDI